MGLHRYICIRIHTCTHKHMSNTFSLTRALTHIHTHIHAHAHTHTHIHTQTHICVYRHNAAAEKPDEQTFIELKDPVALTFALRYLNNFAKVRASVPLLAMVLHALEALGVGCAAQKSADFSDASSKGRGLGGYVVTFVIKLLRVCAHKASQTAEKAKSVVLSWI